MALETERYSVTLRLVTEMLGTVPKNREVYKSFISDKAREHQEKEAKRAAKDRERAAKKGNGDVDDPRFADGTVATAEEASARAGEEIETVPEPTVEDIEAKGWTGFHQDERGPFVYDYFVKGFLCEAARTLKEHGTVKQLQDKFKRYVFPQPRRIYLPIPKEAFSCLERPLRAQTPLGPRVTVVRSDLVPEGTEITFDIVVLAGGGITRKILLDVLEYGALSGFGQWRTGGFGRFEVVKCEKHG